ncbi:MAG: DUF1707 domain-containing protein [Streptosporangiaceae bacterium]
MAPLAFILPDPLFQPQQRASDADRDTAVDSLCAAVAEGRLTLTELDERAGAALSARTICELAALIADLPGPWTPVPAPASVGVSPPASPDRASRAGPGKAVTPRTLRHAFITAALDAGVPLRDVQEAASHADPRTTMRYDRARGSLDRARDLYRRRLRRGCRQVTVRLEFPPPGGHGRQAAAHTGMGHGPRPQPVHEPPDCAGCGQRARRVGFAQMKCSVVLATVSSAVRRVLLSHPPGGWRARLFVPLECR